MKSADSFFVWFVYKLIVANYTFMSPRYQAVVHPLRYKVEATIEKAFGKVAIGWMLGSIAPCIHTYYASQTQLSQLRKSLSPPTFLPLAVTIVTAQVNPNDI